MIRMRHVFRTGKLLFSLALSTALLLPLMPQARALGGSFDDVKDGDWFYEAVTSAVEGNLVSGMSDTKFQPDRPMSRGQFVTVLGRLEASDAESAAISGKFTDVSDDSYWEPYVYWANENGIVNGISESSYRPNGAITREAMAAIIARYLSFKGVVFDDSPEAVSGFRDEDNISGWAIESVEILRRCGILAGDDVGNLNPQRRVRRSEAVTVFMRLAEKLGELGIKTGAEELDSPPPRPLPLEGLVIGIDPGHQSRANLNTEPNAPGSPVMKMRDGGGTQGRWTKTPEYVVCLDVALPLRDKLELQGALVVMTRETNDVDIGNIERAEIFNEAETDYALRLHCNGSENTSVHGAFMLVPTVNPYYNDCVRAAELLINAFCDKTGAKNLGLTYRSDQTGFNWCQRMIILIEMGHMTNQMEDYKLSSPEYQRQMVEGLLDGILDYYTILN